MDPRGQLGDRPAPGLELEKTTKPSIVWLSPTLMLLSAFGGFSVAIIHHFYYLGLHGKVVNSSDQQQWPIRLGTTFSVLAIALLKLSCHRAYHQYIWTLFKRKALSLHTIDKLFTLTAELIALPSLDLLRNAKVACFLSVICLFLPLAGLSPPATLSVIPGNQRSAHMTAFSTLNWSSSNFYDFKSLGSLTGTKLQQNNAYQMISFPSSEVIQVATRSAQAMSIIPISPLASNSSYRLQFFGPSIQCSPANSTHQPFFDYYSSSLANGSVMTITQGVLAFGNLSWNPESVYPQGTEKPLMTLFSAFSPFAGQYGWFNAYSSDDVPVGIDQYNNWRVDLPPTFDKEIHSSWLPANVTLPLEASWDSDPFYREIFVAQQLWIQTSNQSFVCLLGNASFDVEFEFINAVQTRAEYTVSEFKPFWAPRSAAGMDDLTKWGPELSISDVRLPKSNVAPTYAYMSIFMAFSSLLSGNVSASLLGPRFFSSRQYDSKPADFKLFKGEMKIRDASSKILQTGLSACDEVAHSYWDGEHAIAYGETGPVNWRNARFKLNNITCELEWIARNDTAVDLQSCMVNDVRFASVSNHMFEKPPWMCRNHTLPRAIEDLVNNITISMLSSSNLVSQNSTMINVTYTTSGIIYSYSPRNLVLSYGIASAFTIFSLVVGFYSFLLNGGAHFASFSALVSMTRNPDLDRFSDLEVPYDPRFKDIKIRFGQLLRRKEWSLRGSQTNLVVGSSRVGFGLEGNIRSLIVDSGGSIEGSLINSSLKIFSALAVIILLLALTLLAIMVWEVREL